LLPGVTVDKSKDVKDELILTGINIDTVSRSGNNLINVKKKNN
jgi:hypothetical protein